MVRRVWNTSLKANLSFREFEVCLNVVFVYIIIFLLLLPRDRVLRLFLPGDLQDAQASSGTVYN